jgi:hypothetical protein
MEFNIEIFIEIRGIKKTVDVNDFTTTVLRK